MRKCTVVSWGFLVYGVQSFVGSRSHHKKLLYLLQENNYIQQFFTNGTKCEKMYIFEMLGAQCAKGGGGVRLHIHLHHTKMHTLHQFERNPSIPRMRMMSSG